VTLRQVLLAQRFLRIWYHPPACHPERRRCAEPAASLHSGGDRRICGRGCPIVRH